MAGGVGGWLSAPLRRIYICAYMGPLGSGIRGKGEALPGCVDRPDAQDPPAV